MEAYLICWDIQQPQPDSNNFGLHFFLEVDYEKIHDEIVLTQKAARQAMAGRYNRKGVGYCFLIQQFKIILKSLLFALSFATRKSSLQDFKLTTVH